MSQNQKPWFIHLAVAILYGIVFTLAILRSRDAWTLLTVFVATAFLYAGNFAVSDWAGLSRSEPETTAVFAHLIYGAVFTLWFKLAEIGVSDSGFSAGKAARQIRQAGTSARAATREFGV